MGRNQPREHRQGLNDCGLRIGLLRDGLLWDIHVEANGGYELVVVRTPGRETVSA